MRILKPTSYIVLLIAYMLSSCSVQKQIDKSAKADVLSTKALEAAHVGISIYDPAAGKYLYNYQGDHYFVPASNTKIPTCYAAMKYLGDSLVGLRYAVVENNSSKIKLLLLKPTGDPTFLHPDYKNQTVFDFLKITVASFGLVDQLVPIKRWGNGWSWNDYDEAYMAERNALPVFGNVMKIQLNTGTEDASKNNRIFQTQPGFFNGVIEKSIEAYNLSPNQSFSNVRISFQRKMEENEFLIQRQKRKFENITIPFVTKGTDVATEILTDTLAKMLYFTVPDTVLNQYRVDFDHGDVRLAKVKTWYPIHSQPTDSVLKPMMHRSDNFFAEQMLLMVSNEKLGVMNDEAIIDTLLKTDFKDLPQKPRWADGSGLSRYNLFTPQDMVAILKKMKDEFGMDRIKDIFPTGGEGTISSYYKNEAGFIYGKTGTLSGVVAFSGFLYTKKGKLLIFSTLVNNHNESATEVRRAIEKFLIGVREKY